jgi:hypothetical protein
MENNKTVNYYSEKLYNKLILRKKSARSFILSSPNHSVKGTWQEFNELQFCPIPFNYYIVSTRNLIQQSDNFLNAFHLKKSAVCKVVTVHAASPVKKGVVI